MAFLLDNLVVYIVRLVWRWTTILRTCHWERTNASVLGTYANSGISWASANVMYEYAIGDKQHLSGTFVRAFLFSASAQTYLRKYPKGKSFAIRVKPTQPDVSVADSSVENWW